GTLATFAEQVTSVAREVGVEGRLGGQANVPGAAGTWKDLTGNVNLLAANLTTQVRAIAEVATAVTKGDLTRSIQVDARGAVDERRILVTNVPPDTVHVGSVILEALPRNIVVFPVIFEGQIKAVLALASINEFAAAHIGFLEQLTAGLGIVVNSIEATMQTEGLLKQSQKLANELQSQQTDLQQTNEQPEQKAQELGEQNIVAERKEQIIEP